MSGVRKRGMYRLFAIMFVSLMLCPALADDDHHGKHRDREHERREYDEHHEGRLRPVDNPAYKEFCGVCHFVYQPELLPSASWVKILDGLEDHFGEIVELDDNAKREISDYLKSNGAEKSSAKRAVKIMRSLGTVDPMRITDIPYLQEKHHGIPPDFRHSQAVGSMSNCAACHTTAESGIYDDDNVKIPR